MKIQKTYTICIACFISFFCLGTTIHAESFKLWGKQIRSAPPEYQGNTITLKETAVISNVEGNAVNYTIWRVEPDEKDLTGTQTHDNTDLDIGNQSTDPPQTVSGGLTCSGDLKEAYQQHMEAYNHLNYLISRGKGGTSQAQRVYEKHKFYKDCYTRLTQNELDTQQPDGDIVQPDYPGGKITPPQNKRRQGRDRDRRK